MPSVSSTVLEFVDRHPRTKSAARHIVDRTLQPLLPKGIREVTVRRGPLRGTRLMLDLGSSDRDIWLNTYEPWVQAQLGSLLPQVDCFWDIGAYVGTYALLARALNPTVSVLAVEPDPSNARRLEQNLALNGVDSIMLEEAAVGSTPGRAFLATSDTKPMTSRVVASQTGDAIVTTLDALLDIHRPPSLVLMDIEGAEAEALRGASGLLTETRPTWVIELHGEGGFEAYELLCDSRFAIHSTISLPAMRSTLRSRRVHVVATPLVL